MKKAVLVSLLAAAFASPVLAQTAAAAPEAAPASDHTITGNAGLFSSYRFRGIDQTFGKPALQGGIDYSHSSGIYLGNWNSNVSSGAGFPDGNLEMDFYGGYKHAWGDFGLDVGAILYYYPGSDATTLDSAPSKASGSVSNKELYIGASWKTVSLKYSYAIDDYFSLRGWDKTGTSTHKSTKGTSYLDLSGSYDLGDGWGINGHVGYLSAKNMKNASYTDWKLGVTKDVGGWIFGLSYIDTDAEGSCSKNTGTVTDFQPYCFNSSWSDNNGSASKGSSTKDAGRGTALLSVSKSF